MHTFTSFTINLHEDLLRVFLSQLTTRGLKVHAHEKEQQTMLSSACSIQYLRLMMSRAMVISSLE